MTGQDLPSGDGPRADRPKRRTFTAAYKLRMAEKYDAAEHGEKSALLRREGLYESSIQLWRRQRDAGELTASGTPRPPPRRRKRRSRPSWSSCVRKGATGAAERRDGQEAGPDRGCAGHYGKRYRALRDDSRGSGHRQFVTRCRDETFACWSSICRFGPRVLSGVPCGSFYRRRKPVPEGVRRLCGRCRRTR